MLRHSFIHLPGIGQARERKLWQAGCLDWTRFRAELPSLARDEAKRALMAQLLDQAETAYGAGDLDWFHRALPRNQAWRMVSKCFDDIAYLDIESTGMGMPPMAQSTTITFYYRGQVFQAHEHEQKRALIERMSKEAKLWATYFGDGFDLPFLRREFGLALDVPHVDLCPWLRRLGHKGGLKNVQKRFAEIPSRSSLDIDGFDAVRLWRLHQRGVEGALETLYAYNAEDTVVLEALLAIAYNFEVDRHPWLGLARLEVRQPPALKTRVWPEVYAMLRRG